MSKTTVRRTSVCFTRLAERQMVELCTFCGENPSQVITRALQLLHHTLRLDGVKLVTKGLKEGSRDGSNEIQCNNLLK